ncbi:MAG: hypothetical protein ACYDHO_08915, partial [Gaiellaceae bacterium]
MTARRSAIVGAGITALVFLTLATPLFGAGQRAARSSGFDSRLQSFTGPKRLQQPPSRVATERRARAARSSYYFHGKPVWLERSRSELSVRFSAQFTGAGERKTGLGLALSTRPRRASMLRG